MHAHIAIPVPRLEDHLDTEHGPSDEDGEKEAKRQRSEPTTPISTSSRLPYEDDRVMGITQVGSGETEGFEEGTDLVYHDAAEDPNVLESEENSREAVLSHGGCGSSSLRECIELLNNPQRKSPATCHSGPKMENGSGPPHFQHNSAKRAFCNNAKKKKIVGVVLGVTQPSSATKHVFLRVIKNGHRAKP